MKHYLGIFVIEMVRSFYLNLKFYSKSGDKSNISGSRTHMV